MIKIKGSRKLTAEKWLNLFEVRYIAKTGNEKSWQIASRQNEPKCLTGSYQRPDAVVIVPFHTVRNKMVIIREYRVPLDDYEYGFFEPTYTGAITNPSGITYDNGVGNEGYYVKVGRAVFIQINIRTDAISNVGAGDLRISGFFSKIRHTFVCWATSSSRAFHFT